MHLLLLSLHTGAVPQFIADTTAVDDRRLRIGYVIDAEVPYSGLPFVAAARESIASLGHEVELLELRQMSPENAELVLQSLDVLYVAGGSTFALLEALRFSGNDEVLIRHVRAGLPYIGCSAGSAVTGPDIAPLSLMDDPADGPHLRSTAGLALIDRTVLPHADGRLPQYPTQLIERTLQTYGDEYPLVQLRDDQALCVDGAEERIIPSEE